MKVLHISLVDKDKLPVAVAGITILACVYLVYRTHTASAAASIKCHLEFFIIYVTGSYFFLIFFLLIIIRVVFFKGFSRTTPVSSLDSLSED